MATTVFPHFFSENKVQEMIVLSSLHRICILRYSGNCRLYTVRCKAGMFVFITLYDSRSSCVAEVRGWVVFWFEWGRCSWVKHSRRSGGSQVLWYNKDEQLRWVAHTYPGLGRQITQTQYRWLVRCIASFLLYLVLCSTGSFSSWRRGRLQLWLNKKKRRWAFCFSSPFFFVKTRSCPSGFMSSLIFFIFKRIECVFTVLWWLSLKCIMFIWSFAFLCSSWAVSNHVTLLRALLLLMLPLWSLWHVLMLSLCPKKLLLSDMCQPYVNACEKVTPIFNISAVTIFYFAYLSASVILCCCICFVF